MTQALHNQKPILVTEQHWQVAPQSIKDTSPYSIESEKALLGGLMIAPNMFPLIATKLIAEDFFILRHAYVFRAMQQAFTEFKTFDLVILEKLLRDKKVLDEIGGVSFLTSLVNETPNSVYVPVYAELIVRTAVRRRILIATDKIRELAINEEMAIDDVIAGCEQQLAVATVDYSKKQEKHWIEVVNDVTDHILDPEPESQSLEFPIQNIQFKLVNGEQTMLAGLTGTGKTAFTLWIILYHLRQGKNIIFISMEMSKEKILYRLLAQITGIDATAIQRNSYPENKKADVLGAIAECSKYGNQLTIAETAYTPSAIKRVVASEAYTQDIHLVVVDHLKISDSDNRGLKGFQVWETNATEFQRQAKEFNCPYLVLHQLNDPPVHRADKTPYASDIFGRKSVQNVPDNIYAIHRDDHSDLAIPDYESGRVDLYELKDRNGGNNTRKLNGFIKYLGNERYGQWTVRNDYYLTN